MKIEIDAQDFGYIDSLATRLIDHLRHVEKVAWDSKMISTQIETIQGFRDRMETRWDDAIMRKGEESTE